MSINLERMLNGYRDCAEFADCSVDNETHGKDWSDELQAKMRADCAAFLAICGDELLDELAEFAPDYSDERFGHDFWLTRNGHGAGYWDRDELAVVPDGKTYKLGDRLSQIAGEQGNCDLYVGDDGLVYA